MYNILLLFPSRFGKHIIHLKLKNTSAVKYFKRLLVSVNQFLNEGFIFPSCFYHGTNGEHQLIGKPSLNILDPGKYFLNTPLNTNNSTRAVYFFCIILSERTGHTSLQEKSATQPLYLHLGKIYLKTTPEHE